MSDRSYWDCVWRLSVYIDFGKCYTVSWLFVVFFGVIVLCIELLDVMYVTIKGEREGSMGVGREDM